MKKSLLNYLNREAWPGSPYGMTAADVYELATACKERTKDDDRNTAITQAVLEAAGAGFAAGFERGQRKAKNDHRRAKQIRPENQARKEKRIPYGPQISLGAMTKEQADSLQEYLTASGIRYTVTNE